MGGAVSGLLVQAALTEITKKYSTAEISLSLSLSLSALSKTKIPVKTSTVILSDYRIKYLSDKNYKTFGQRKLAVLSYQPLCNNRQ